MRVQGEGGGRHQETQSHVHGIAVRWWLCDYSGCEHRAKLSCNITTHKANKHNIGVLWKQCAHCDYKAKSNGQITTHKANVHNIGVQWRQCSHCDYKAKTNSDLTRHKADKHNIDKVR